MKELKPQTSFQSLEPDFGLVRHLGLFTGVTMVVSSMIGSGVFKKVASMAGLLHSPQWVIAAWLLAGAVSLMGALTNAEVAGLICDPGGQYAYFKRMYGRAFSFFFGWASFTVIQSATAAAVAFVFAQSLNTLLPLPRLNPELESLGWGGWFTPLDNIGVKIVAITLILALTKINVRGVKNGGKVSDGIAVLMLASITLLAFIGFFGGAGSSDNLKTDSTLEAVPLGWSLFALMFLAMRDAFWAYEGWNNLGYLGGEIKRPERNIPLSLMLGVGLIVLLYTGVNLSYLYVLPIDELIAISKTENGIAAVAVIDKLLGQGGVIVISILIMIATFGSTNGVLLTASRLYYAMACDKLFFKKGQECHPVHKTPSGALWLQGIWASILVLSGSFDQLTNMLVFAAFIYYCAMAAGVFILRFKMPDSYRPYKAFGYPYIPALFIVFCLVLVGVALVESPHNSLVGLGLIATGLPFYLSWSKAS